MGKKDVVKPGYFKLAGRIRQSDDTGVKMLAKEKYAEEKAAEAFSGRKPVPAGRAAKKGRTKAAG